MSSRIAVLSQMRYQRRAGPDVNHVFYGTRPGSEVCTLLLSPPTVLTAFKMSSGKMPKNHWVQAGRKSALL